VVRNEKKGRARNTGKMTMLGQKYLGFVNRYLQELIKDFAVTSQIQPRSRTVDLLQESKMAMPNDLIKQYQSKLLGKTISDANAETDKVSPHSIISRK